MSHKSEALQQIQATRQFFDRTTRCLAESDSSFRATPDTITFLTDGTPTKGDIIDGDTLLEWYTGLNRYARVKTHTISFGTVGIDMPLLEAMATRNGGKFTLVPEKKIAKK